MTATELAPPTLETITADIAFLKDAVRDVPALKDSVREVKASTEENTRQVHEVKGLFQSFEREQKVIYDQLGGIQREQGVTQELLRRMEQDSATRHAENKESNKRQELIFQSVEPFFTYLRDNRKQAQAIIDRLFEEQDEEEGWKKKKREWRQSWKLKISVGIALLGIYAMIKIIANTTISPGELLKIIF